MGGAVSTGTDWLLVVVDVSGGVSAGDGWGVPPEDAAELSVPEVDELVEAAGVAASGELEAAGGAGASWAEADDKAPHALITQKAIETTKRRLFFK